MATSRRGTRMLKASDIMKRKGIVQKQMDMNKFNEVIENFFMTHEPKETILLTPKRFIEMDNPPEGDFIDYLDVSVWEKKCDDPGRSIRLHQLSVYEEERNATSYPDGERAIHR